MLEFAYPWVIVLAPLPLLVWWLAPPYREERRALRIPFFEMIADQTGLKPQAGAVVMRRNLLQQLFAPLIWTLLLTAVARPLWVEEPIERIQSGRDLMLAVDVSQSMDTRDFVDPNGERIDRLEAVKLVLGDFIERRKGDRIGLIVFGGGAYPQAPFTLDHAVCLQMLEETGIGMAGPRTVVGDAIGLSIKLFENSEATERTLVLLTDGNDTGSKMPPDKAADIAARNGIAVHTIGIGDPSGTGDDRVDLSALQAISDKTGGRFFRGEDRAGLEDIYRTLDELEPDEFETLSYRPKRPLFHIPLGAALVLLLLYHLLMGGYTALRALFRKKATAAAEAS